MKIIAISDIHGYLPELEPCDVVCICGDIIPLEMQRDIFQSWWWFNNPFREWTESLECEKVILIGGNHDFFLDGEEPFESGKIVYLKDSGYTHNEIKFWGSPWITGLPRWAFNLSERDQEKEFEKIPTGIHVLLTHTPPFDVEDIARVDWRQGNPVDYGSKALTKILKIKEPVYALAGHIHSGNHKPIKFGKTTLYNVSLKDETYEVNYKPLIIEL